MIVGRLLGGLVVLSAALSGVAPAVALPDAGAGAALPETVNFNRDIRPILSDNCFACHGFDEATREADLRLDVRDGIFSEREGGRLTVAPGKPAESELYRRLTHADESERMPPKKFNKRPTERQIALVKKWIEQGAQWQGHWSYAPPERPEAPPADLPGFVRNPIDRFVLSRLQEAGLAPSPEADRATLIRRLSFDLTGLPPTPQEVDAFVNDVHSDAYEKLVDRLLASPAYGERMAMYWLDLVRYADSIGYHSDNPMNVSPYRDYVIKSFNENKPFDRFTIEQIAGDLLPDATLEQKVASAYNRLLQTTEEGGAQPKEYTAKYASDRVRNASTVWLGQTVGCAECHDHKFDPITTKDFYSFAAFFADIQEAAVGRREPGMPVPDARQAAELKRLDDAIAAAKAKLNADTPELAAARAEWEREAGAGDVMWAALDPESWDVSGESKLREEAEGVLRSTYKVGARESYKINVKTDVKGITGFRLETLADDELPSRGPGTAPNGNFVLTEFKVSVGGESKPLKLRGAAADHSQEGYPVANAIDGRRNTGWAILPHAGKPHEAVFELDAPLDAAGDGPVELTFSIEFQSQFPQHNIGKLRLSATAEPNPARLLLPARVKDALAVTPAERTEQQVRDLTTYYRTIAPALQPAREELAALEKQKVALLDATPKVLVAVSGEPRTMRVLPRGNWLDDSGPVVTPAVPGAFGKLDVGDRRATRLDLARWLVSRDNPLTARVFVNRLWKLYFGTGLSKVLDDLGSQGEWPTHPALLDWLAVEFMEPGVPALSERSESKWDVKHMVRLIVTSGAYRQASKPTPIMKERDPFNRLLARQSRFRLDAEMVRDNALAVSGLLVNQAGGPSVFPYQPAGYWSALNFPVREWQNGQGNDLYRRGLYTHWQRTFLHPSLLAFDAPSREEATCERARSNIPQQALVLLNDPTYVEAARVFAEKVVREGGSATPARLNWAFRRALSRQPSDAEVQLLTELLHEHTAEYVADVESALDLIDTGDAPVPEDIDAAILAAWTNVARVILNLHETITRP